MHRIHLSSQRAILFVLLVLLLSFATRIDATAQALAPAPDAHVINITPGGHFNEPSIAVNPNNPAQLVAAYQGEGPGVSYSTDSGRHWIRATGTSPSDYKFGGDVSVTYDNKGHAFLCYIATDKLGTWNYWAHNATRNTVHVLRSLDGGRTWEKEAAAIVTNPTGANIFEDKPYIIADNDNPSSPYSGNLYLGWTEFTLSKSVVMFSRSTDFGKTWSTPIEISTHEGWPRGDSPTAVLGFAGAVGPDGRVYTVWADGSSIVFTHSEDGGRTFVPSREILKVAPLCCYPIHDMNESNGLPQIAIDPKSKRLYVAWSDYRNGGIDIFVSTSDDGGESWSPALRVNSDPLHNALDHFFQWMAVDPIDDAVNVIFYDRRDDPENRKTTVVLARSTDGGRTFVNYAWMKKPFTINDDFIGDYTGLTAINGRVYGIWTETAPPLPISSAGEQQNQFPQ